ncbi:MAG: hypothetical protein HY704_15525 [Gemmatimonadetes bacterium]|nr:hypothetical protein [Gemmatimonadota bacterium]
MRLLGALLCCVITGTGCVQGTEPEPISYATIEVSSGALPAVDPDRVYKYRFASVNADSVLRVLWHAGAPLVEAWLPLEDLCADPVGPRFTVILSRPEPDVERFDFVPGSGIRACTIKVRWFVIAS